MAKGQVKKWNELTEAQKADVRKRMKSPYANYHYKLYGSKVAYRFIDRPAPKRKDPLGFSTRPIRFVR